MQCESCAVPNESGGERTTSPGRGALASLSLAMLLSALGTSIANVGLPTLSRAFVTSFQEVQWIVLAYLLAITSLIVIAGRLGDLFGRRHLLLVGIVIFTIASAFCGLAPNLGVLIAARAAQGVGAAFLMALPMAMVGDTVPREMTGRAMGLLGSMSAIGTALGPSLGGALITLFGWRALFFVNVPLGILTFLLALRYMPSCNRGGRREVVGVDIFGTLLLAVSLAAYALSMTTRRAQFGVVNGLLLLAFVCALSLFLVVESRARWPLIRLTMFRDAGLGASLGMSAIVSTVIMTTLVVGPFYLSGALELKSATIGLVMSIGPVVASLVSLPAGRLADRFGESRMILVGLLGIGLGACGMAALSKALGIAGYLLPIVIMTAGYALFQTANNTSVMSGIGSNQRGVVSGLLNLSRNLGLVTGTSLMGAIFSKGSGAGDIASASVDQIVTGARITFAVGAVLIVVAITMQRCVRRRPSSGCGRINVA